MANDEEDEVSLPQDTIEILNQFLAEKIEREKREQECVDIKTTNEIQFEENWQLSQFWYSKKTIEALTSVVKRIIIDPKTTVGLLSCPSLYNSVKKAHENTKLFEFDMRFAILGEDFVFYDFNEADTPNYLAEYIDYFDIIIVDPPFLSEDCIKNISEIVTKLSKISSKIIFCSGETVEPWIKRYLKLNKCSYQPEHERNLGNAFVSYANFNLDDLL